METFGHLTITTSCTRRLVKCVTCNATMNNRLKQEDTLLWILILIVMALATLMAGSWLTLGPLVSIFKSSQTKSWTHVNARITSVTYGRSVIENGGGLKSSHSRSGVIPSIVYVYKFQGAEYQNRRVSYGLPTVGIRRLGHVTQGSAVSAWVNPADPSESILVRVSPLEGKCFYLIPLGLITLGAGTLSALAARKLMLSRARPRRR